jgi:hypothetical protein
MFDCFAAETSSRRNALVAGAALAGADMLMHDQGRSQCTENGC